jgi:glycosyltransferase involved in cell wall biosynthesis
MEKSASGFSTLSRSVFVILRVHGVVALLQLATSFLKRIFPQGSTPSSDFPGWFSKNSQYVSSRLNSSNATGFLVSIVLPVYRPNLRQLETAIESVLGQTYQNWELCIVDDCSEVPELVQLLERFAKKDKRVRFRIRDVSAKTAVASNDALIMATGKYVTFLDHDGELLPWALDSVSRMIRTNPQGQMFYSDEAIVDSNSIVQSGHIKGGLNRTLAWSYNYFCHLTVYSKNLLNEIGNFNEEAEGAQDYDLALKALEALEDQQIVHIPEVLYFAKEKQYNANSSAEEKPNSFDAAIGAIQRHLSRIGVHGSVEQSREFESAFRVRIDVDEEDNSVSVVIPTRDNLKTLSVCLDTLLNVTAYQNFEVIIVDNGSRKPDTKQYLSEITKNPKVKVLNIDLPFNYSLLNNAAARVASGRHILLLNDDTQIIDKDWMREMVSFSQLPFVGAVGAKLLYPDLRVQHGGVILGLGLVAGHANRLLDSKDAGYEGRAVLQQDFMAVTAACLMIEKEIFWRVSGLDEGLAIALNDVDFCLRVHKLGLRNVFNPFAELIHHESLSRGSDSSPENIARAWTEIDFMRKRWGSLLQKDPYYSINFSNSSPVYNFANPPRLRDQATN